MINFGSQKIIYPLDAKGSTIASITKFRNGETERAIKHYKIRIKVHSSQDEMAEFIRFTAQLEDIRKKGQLVTDKEDQSTKPAFIIEYPTSDIDGSYYVIKNYCVKV